MGSSGTLLIVSTLSEQGYPVDALQIAGQSIPIAVLSLVAGVVYALLFDRILKRRFGDKRRKRRQTNMTWTLSTAIAEFFYCIIGLILLAQALRL